MPHITLCDYLFVAGARIAGSLGDAELYSKMEEASALIKRDIVFAASLYVQ